MMMIPLLILPVIASQVVRLATLPPDRTKAVVTFVSEDRHKASLGRFDLSTDDIRGSMGTGPVRGLSMDYEGGLRGGTTKGDYEGGLRGGLATGWSEC